MNTQLKNSLKKIRNLLHLLFSNNTYKVKGNNNKINRNLTSHFRDTHIQIHGNNNTIIFGNKCDIASLHMLVVGDNNIIKFGEHVVVNASKIQSTVINAIGGRKIEIGDDSLFSNNIEIHTSDYHGIYDFSGKRLNYEKDITIGKKVWIGLGCKILKGSFISDYSIVGAGTLVAQKFLEKNVVIVGNPAHIIKKNVFWDEKSVDFIQKTNLENEK